MADRLFVAACAAQRRPKSGSKLRNSDGLWGIPSGSAFCRLGILMVSENGHLSDR
jgi:hypothetical protein